MIGSIPHQKLRELQKAGVGISEAHLERGTPCPGMERWQGGHMDQAHSQKHCRGTPHWSASPAFDSQDSVSIFEQISETKLQRG